MLNAVGRRVKAGWKALGIDWKVACLMFKYGILSLLRKLFADDL